MAASKDTHTRQGSGIPCPKKDAGRPVGIKKMIFGA